MSRAHRTPIARQTPAPTEATTRALVILAAAVLLLALTPERASADPFNLMDMAEPEIGVEAQVGVIFDLRDQRDSLLGSSEEPPTVLRTDLVLQGGNGSFGAYVHLPIAAVYPSDSNAESTTALGNVEIGALYDLSLMDILGLQLRLGFVIPTIADDAADIGANAGAILGRPTDAIHGIYDAVGVRVAASPRVDLGIVFVQADVGFDFAFLPDASFSSSGIGSISIEQEDPIFFRANLAAGVSLGLIEVGAELVNIGEIATEARSDDRFFHAVGVGLGASLPIVKPRIGVSFPLNEESSGDFLVFHIGLEFLPMDLF